MSPAAKGLRSLCGCRFTIRPDQHERGNDAAGRVRHPGGSRGEAIQRGRSTGLDLRIRRRAEHVHNGFVAANEEKLEAWFLPQGLAEVAVRGSGLLR
jgi:hypothetical protein